MTRNISEKMKNISERKKKSIDTKGEKVFNSDDNDPQGSLEASQIEGYRSTHNNLKMKNNQGAMKLGREKITELNELKDSRVNSTARYEVWHEEMIQFETTKDYDSTNLVGTVISSVDAL